MTKLLLPWMLLTILRCGSGSGQILQQETVNVLYPKILSTEVINCDCVEISCDSVFWFRSNSNHRKLQFLGKVNNADRPTHGNGVEEARFRLYKKSSVSFSLQIVNVQEEDAGIYSCVLKDRKNTEMWKPGILLRPGVIPPTLTPTTEPKPPVNSVCRCAKKDSSYDGCSSLVLWPLVGLTAALALALICTLYYFSRLPKKCRHHIKR
uniref:Cd8b protein n=1 Tax=Chaunax abei TaxID=181417 RepID=A0A7S8WI91_CHAAE|nr:Cd8b protein [Chaunax abei]